MLNKINFFQFDNLINNRVPFLFFNMSEDLRPWYTSVSRMHLDSYQILVNPDQVIATIEEKKAPKDYAIVLLCAEGSDSLQLYSLLQNMSYTNVYVIDGGYQQMVTERAHA